MNLDFQTNHRANLLDRNQEIVMEIHMKSTESPWFEVVSNKSEKNQ